VTPCFITSIDCLLLIKKKKKKRERERERAKNDDNSVSSNITRNTDLKPMPFCPMYPALDPFFVEFPTSQSALMFLAEKPCSLFRTTIPDS